IQPDGTMGYVEKSKVTFSRTNQLVICNVRVVLTTKDFPLVREDDRCEVSNTRLDLKKSPLLIGVKIRLSLHVWARTHKAHITHQDIPKLSRFVQLETPNEMTNGRDASVVGRGRIHSRSICVDD